jgi:hypothetical protein
MMNLGVEVLNIYQNHTCYSFDEKLGMFLALLETGDWWRFPSISFDMVATLT